MGAKQEMNCEHPAGEHIRGCKAEHVLRAHAADAVLNELGALNFRYARRWYRAE